jgi:hypothetical protein
LASPDQVNERLRQFWRLRRHAEPEHVDLSDQILESPAVTPLDSIKTFVGANGTYYDECWRSMDLSRRRRGWNWAAGLTFGGWLAYRRMYMAATAALIYQGVLLAMALNGVWIWPLLAAQVALMYVMSSYGNAHYMMRFRRAALRVAEGDGEHAERLAALAQAGGTDPAAVYVMGGCAGLVIAAVMAITFGVFDGIVINR